MSSASYTVCQYGAADAKWASTIRWCSVKGSRVAEDKLRSASSDAGHRATLEKKASAAQSPPLTCFRPPFRGRYSALPGRERAGYAPRMSDILHDVASIDYPILDADAHVNEPPDLWQSRVP